MHSREILISWAWPHLEINVLGDFVGTGQGSACQPDHLPWILLVRSNFTPIQINPPWMLKEISACATFRWHAWRQTFTCVERLRENICLISTHGACSSPDRTISTCYFLPPSCMFISIFMQELVFSFPFFKKYPSFLQRGNKKSIV